MSSPHARGSSPVRAPAGHGHGVVPARAGIFRSTPASSACPSSRPRTRGDLPPELTVKVILAESSPHARGSSVVRVPLRPAPFVVPARAGIFRATDHLPACGRGRPRTRGDLPSLVIGRNRAARSSPHARGSSRCAEKRPVVRGVVPARAGIFPDIQPDGRPRKRRPRTRGDLPSRVRSQSTRQRSSPHARGSSRRGRARGVSRAVVPARAGIFRSCSRGCRSGLGRPRTRGDLPSPISSGSGVK